MVAAEFYFDYSCPWCYLAHVRLAETTRRLGAETIWRPVLLDQVLASLDPGSTAQREIENPRKAAHEADDIDAWADYVGVRINKPPGWPADSTAAMRAAIVATRHGKAREFSDEVFAAYFGSAKDIAGPDLLLEIADIVDLDREIVAAGLADPEVAAELQANCDALIARGGFGAPTLFVGEQMFFGSDRMPLVEFALGQASDQTFVMPGQHG